MAIWSRLANLFVPRTANRPRLSRTAPRAVPLRARYDNAQTGTDNYKHWAAADALSADAANSLSVRKRLRERSRYERANNCYCAGLVQSMVHYEVGTGPRIEVRTANPGFNAMVERLWDAWSSAINLAEKVRTLVAARIVDGEAFALLVSKPVPEGEVGLDLVPIEADQVTTPQPMLELERNWIDGIRFDEFGYPVTYDVLDDHPGGLWRTTSFTARSVPARMMLHLFRADRPGQHRGVPELTPALGLFAEMRRYTEAVIAAAETAAEWAVLLHTTSPPNQEADEVAPLDSVEFERRMLTTLPAGWQATQIHPENPPAVFREFRQELLGEMGRAVSVPRSLSSADSSDANFSSAKLDHLGYYRAVAVNQSQIEARLLDRLFAAWFEEAVWRYGWDVPDSPAPRHEWRWIPPREADEETLENARQTRIKSGATSLRREFAAQGLDYETELAAAAEDYGITVEDYKLRLLDAHFPPAPVPTLPEPTNEDRAQSRRAAEADGTAASRLRASARSASRRNGDQ